MKDKQLLHELYITVLLSDSQLGIGLQDWTTFIVIFQKLKRM